MFIKIHKSYRDVVAICDDDLLGKKFEEGKFQLDVKENFYNGEKVTKEKLKEILEKMSAEDATFNIVGEESILIAVKAGIIHESGIIKIHGIPFAMILM